MPDFIWNYSTENIGNRQKRLNLKAYKFGLVIGCGGIGSWVALDCALSGRFDTLIIFDNDDIETTNLNRTPFRVCDIGFQKVQAMHELIIERRPSQKLICVNERFTFKKLLELDNSINPKNDINGCSTIVFDCRDDIYDDLNQFKSNVKIWKLGYDGLELTIDGNPRKHHVWGQSQGYTTVPSFLYPSQLIANLVVGHVLIGYDKMLRNNDFVDSDGMFKDVFTFDSGNIIYDMIYSKILRQHINFNLKTNPEKDSVKDEENSKENRLPVEHKNSGCPTEPAVPSSVS